MIGPYDHVISRSRGWLWRYDLWREPRDFPGQERQFQHIPHRSFVGIYVTLRGARRAAERDRRRQLREAEKARTYRTQHPDVERIRPPR